MTISRLAPAEVVAVLAPFGLVGQTGPRGDTGPAGPPGDPGPAGANSLFTAASSEFTVVSGQLRTTNLGKISRRTVSTTGVGNAAERVIVNSSSAVTITLTTTTTVRMVAIMNRGTANVTVKAGTGQTLAGGDFTLEPSISDTQPNTIWCWRNPSTNNWQIGQREKAVSAPPPTDPAQYPTWTYADGTRTGTASKQAWEAGFFLEKSGVLMQDFSTTSRDSTINLTGLNNGGRIRVSRGRAQANQQIMRDMAASGIKATIHGGVYDQTTGTTPDTPAQILSTVKAVGVDCFFAVAGPNEPNHATRISNSTTFWQYLRDYQQDLYNTFHNDPATQNVLHICGPSWANNELTLIPNIGDINAWITAHEIHVYPKANFPPERSGIFSDKATQLALIGDIATKPVFITEMGWHTHDTEWAPDDAVVYKDMFMPRLYLYSLDHGCGSMINYRDIFNDNLTPGVWTFGVSEDCYGWLKPNGEVQSSYTSCQRMFSLLADPGPRFNAGTLDYTIGGTTTNVNYTLLQKRNGRFYLCIWVALYANTNRSITITLPASITNARKANPNTSTTWSNVTITNNVISATVNGYVTIFELW